MASLDAVRDSLLAELDALDSASGEALKTEIGRANAKVGVAEQLNALMANKIAVARLASQTLNHAEDGVVRAINGLIEESHEG